MVVRYRHLSELYDVGDRRRPRHMMPSSDMANPKLNRTCVQLYGRLHAGVGMDPCVLK